MKMARGKHAFRNFEKQLRDKPILPFVDNDEENEIDDARATTRKLRNHVAKRKAEDSDNEDNSSINFNHLDGEISI